MKVQGRGHFCSAAAFALWTALLCASTTPSPAQTSRDFSGWRGGIGITFGTPSREIPDVTELGYEIAWGSEEPRAIRALDLSVFRYWNSIVETSLKGASYDFSGMADKDEAARLAFDAWMARSYGVTGLSKYASVRYNPKGAYGDVYGSMDLSSENELVRAVVASYLDWFERNGVRHGGIALDNAGKVPREFLEVLRRRLNARGLGIAANGCPNDYLPFIDFFGNEGFPFTVEFGRRAHSKGHRGILGEFTMQHLSSGELAAYLESKLFNGIVFFGYTNGGTAAGAEYSAYAKRPDVYEHQRWVFRRLVPLSRALQKAGRQEQPLVKLAAGAQTVDVPAGELASVKTNTEGKVVETKRTDAGLQRITGRSPTTPAAIARYGSDAGDGIYLYVDSGKPKEVVCEARKLGIGQDTLIFDALAERRLESRSADGILRFRTLAGPTVVQLGSKSAVAGSLLTRVKENLEQQSVQRKMDHERGTSLLRKAWPRFCQGWKPDKSIASSGSYSLSVEGGSFIGRMPQWKYFNRQGAAQLVRLNQIAPQSIVLTARSKAENVVRSDEVDLNVLAARRKHFDAREGHTYCMHLYLDFQDGQWPTVHTTAFKAGTHDWEEKSIRVSPTRPVKTALVLIEFHQPEGKAWFDDLVLAQSGHPDRNLLACHSFEEDDPAIGRARSASKDYQQRVATLLGTVDAARQHPLKGLSAIEKQVDVLADWIEAQGIAPYYSRELRDLDDARHQLDVCGRL